MSRRLLENGKPFLGLWFGNFFEPFYSDPSKVRAGLKDAAGLGFTSVNLDSKAWADFFARYAGGEASTYVATQELMMKECEALGLSHTHLALYLCGDNLYPGIRDVPPVRGEEPLRPNGTPMGTYKYWSPIAQKTMVEHVTGLLRLYSKGMSRFAGTPPRRVMQTMFEPVVRPSFDEEGRSRYLSWLEHRYGGDLALLNCRYGLSARSFEELRPEDYWYRPEVLDWINCAVPSEQDFAERSPAFFRWVDNQRYLGEELEGYLVIMLRHWRSLAPDLFVEPVLHQWGFFFNPPGQAHWQTGKRALDAYRVGKHVDGVLFISSPLNAENDPDATALSIEGAIGRAANRFGDFTAGLYLGRHVNGDIYRQVPPGESIATLVAAGASGLHMYGYSGLDDGGVMYRMDNLFRESLRAGNAWAAAVIPKLDAPRAREAAILFPAETSFYEPADVGPRARHRTDLLGWYAQLVDLGYAVDILHPEQVVAGEIAAYRLLVVPANPFYDLGENAALEKAVASWVGAGGCLLHGPACQLAQKAFAIRQKAVPFDCIRWREDIIPHGWSTVAYEEGENLGAYIQSGEKGIARLPFEKGAVYSFGFEYGYAYARRTMPVVPSQYGRSEMHPIVLLEKTPLEVLFGRGRDCLVPPEKGLEQVRFGSRYILVNHRSTAVRVAVPSSERLPLDPWAGEWLPGHSALYLAT